jgi:hypothetical protein
LDLLVRRRKRDTTTRFWKQTWFQIKTNIKKGKFVLERTKILLKKRNKTKNKRFLFGHFVYLTTTWTVYIFKFSALTTIQYLVQTGGQIDSLCWIGAPLFENSSYLRYTFSPL